MSPSRDPQGKRALFTGGDPAPSSAENGSEGKVALFSAATRRVGTLVVECESCQGRSRLSYVDFVRRQMPLTLWMPWRRHSRLMGCPACGRRTWLAAHWFE